jgi:hypothetical protein
MIGNPSHRTHLGERHRLAPVAAWKDEQAVDLAIVRQNARGKDLARRHPFGQIAEIGTAYLEGGKDLGTQNAERLAGSKARQLGG